MQQLLFDKVELGLHALVGLDEVMKRFEGALKADEFRGLQSEEQYFVIKGLIEEFISGMVAVLCDLKVQLDPSFARFHQAGKDWERDDSDNKTTGTY